MSSLAQLKDCAERHLWDFVNPAGPRSFATYDRIEDPADFGPLDALAPALLDAPLKRDEVNQMFSGVVENPYNILRIAIQHCLKVLSEMSVDMGKTFNFAEAEISEVEGPWALVRACYIASDNTPNIKASKVSKMLHRKQPTFIPIIDSKLVSFYGLTMREPSKYWTELQKDIRVNSQFLNEICNGVITSEGVPISRLRVADIVIWEHIVTGCAGSQ